MSACSSNSSRREANMSDSPACAQVSKDPLRTGAIYRINDSRVLRSPMPLHTRNNNARRVITSLPSSVSMKGGTAVSNHFRKPLPMPVMRSQRSMSARLDDILRSSPLAKLPVQARINRESLGNTPRPIASSRIFRQIPVVIDSLKRDRQNIRMPTARKALKAEIGSKKSINLTPSSLSDNINSVPIDSSRPARHLINETCSSNVVPPKQLFCSSVTAVFSSPTAEASQSQSEQLGSTEISSFKSSKLPILDFSDPINIVQKNANTPPSRISMSLPKTETSSTAITPMKDTDLPCLQFSESSALSSATYHQRATLAIDQKIDSDEAAVSSKDLKELTSSDSSSGLPENLAMKVAKSSTMSSGSRETQVKASDKVSEAFNQSSSLHTSTHNDTLSFKNCTISSDEGMVNKSHCNTSSKNCQLEDIANKSNSNMSSTTQTRSMRRSRRQQILQTKETLKRKLSPCIVSRWSIRVNDEKQLCLWNFENAKAQLRGRIVSRVAPNVVKVVHDDLQYQVQLNCMDESSMLQVFSSPIVEQIRKNGLPIEFHNKLLLDFCAHKHHAEQDIILKDTIVELAQSISASYNSQPSANCVLNAAQNNEMKFEEKTKSVNRRSSAVDIPPSKCSLMNQSDTATKPCMNALPPDTSLRRSSTGSISQAKFVTQSGNESRRTSRVRFKPIQFWKCERIIVSLDNGNANNLQQSITKLVTEHHGKPTTQHTSLSSNNDNSKSACESSCSITNTTKKKAKLSPNESNVTSEECVDRKKSVGERKKSSSPSKSVLSSLCTMSQSAKKKKKSLKGTRNNKQVRLLQSSKPVILNSKLTKASMMSTQNPIKEANNASIPNHVVSDNCIATKNESKSKKKKPLPKNRLDSKTLKPLINSETKRKAEIRKDDRQCSQSLRKKRTKKNSHVTSSTKVTTAKTDFNETKKICSNEHAKKKNSADSASTIMAASARAWSADEIARLQLVKQHTDPLSKSFWSDVSNKFPGRSMHECQQEFEALFPTPKTKSSARTQRMRPQLSLSKVVQELPSAGKNMGVKQQRRVRQALADASHGCKEDIFDSNTVQLFPPDLSSFSLSLKTLPEGIKENMLNKNSSFTAETVDRSESDNYANKIRSSIAKARRSTKALGRALAPLAQPSTQGLRLKSVFSKSADGSSLCAEISMDEESQSRSECELVFDDGPVFSDEDNVH